MSVRLRAEARLDRHVPDVAGWEAREPASRIARRDAPPPPPRPLPSDRLPVHTAAIRPPKLAQPARPSPNAPLLMRIVRTPFALEPVKLAKRTLIDPWEPVRREPLGRPGDALRELADAIGLPNPIRATPHRPEPRPRPIRRSDGGEP